MIQKAGLVYKYVDIDETNLHKYYYINRSPSNRPQKRDLYVINV